MSEEVTISTGLLSEQLVATAFEGLANEKIFTVLSRTNVPSDILQNLQKELEKEYGDRVFWPVQK